MIEQTEAARLASAINALRPEWPTQSLLTFIRDKLSHRAYRDAAVALTWAACDPTTLTPARVLEAGPWWNATTAQGATVSAISHHCPIPGHGDQKAWDCKHCADEVADAAAGLAKVRAELARAPRPPIAAEPRPAQHADLTTTRTRADREGSDQ